MKKILNFTLMFVMIFILFSAVQLTVHASAENLLDVNPPYDNTGSSATATFHTNEGTTSVSMGGVEYKNAIEFRNTATSISGSRSLRFNFDSKYITLSGMIGPVDGSSITNSTISFVGDGESLHEITVIGGTLPVPFTVNVSNINQLRIDYTGPARNRTALANLVVTTAQQVSNVTITATAGTGGSVTGGGIYSSGSSITLRATPNSGFSFDGWYENNTRVSTNATWSFTALSNRTLQARFIQQNVNPSLTISTEIWTTSSTAANTVISITSNVSWTASSNATSWLTVSPSSGSNNGSITVSVTTNSSSIQRGGIITVTGGGINRIIQVAQAAAVSNVTITATASTGGSVTGGGTYSSGSSVTLRATPNSGYDFDGWYENNTRVSTNAVWSFTASSNRTLQARFVQRNVTPILTISPATWSPSSAAANTLISMTSNVSWTASSNAASWLTFSPLSGSNNSNITVNGGIMVYVTNNSGTTSRSGTITITGGGITRTITVTQAAAVSNVTIIATAGTGGSVTGGGTYPNGSLVTLRATPNSGYNFDGWYESKTRTIVNTNATWSFNASSDITLQAIFFQQQSLTINASTWSPSSSAANTVIPVTSNISWTASSNAASWLTVSPTSGSNNGSLTLNVTNNLGSASRRGTITVTGSGITRTITVTQAAAATTVSNVTITATAGSGGSVTGGGTYSNGTWVTLRATPNSNYDFAGWYEGSNRVSANDIWTFTASSNRTFQARFERRNVTITATAGSGGSVTGGGTYSNGTSVTLRATPNSGYDFDGWYENYTRVSTNATWTFTASSNRTLQARFTQRNVTITVTAGPGGSVTGGRTYPNGGSVTLRATPNSGHDFYGWYENNRLVSENATWSFTASSNRTLQARFYTINVTAPNIGSASGWAVDQINQAYRLGLIPSELQSNYNRPATRAEFAALAVALYEKVIGREITGRASFADTTDVNAQKAAAIGVMSPRNSGRTIFGPNIILSRQDSAGTFVRLANLIGKPLPEGRANFADNNRIASWAIEPVGRVAAARIMSAGSGNNFNPTNSLTREECIAAMLRLFNR